MSGYIANLVHKVESLSKSVGFFKLTDKENSAQTNEIVLEIEKHMNEIMRLKGKLKGGMLVQEAINNELEQQPSMQPQPTTTREIYASASDKHKPGLNIKLDDDDDSDYENF